MTKIITHIRTYGPTATPGILHYNDKHAYTLEDIARPVGIKFPGTSCIPEGVYRASVTMSTRFKRDLVLLTSTTAGNVAKYGNVWTGIRAHGGNDIDDTDGCVLVGAKTNGVDRVWDCAGVERDLVEYVRANSGTLWVVTSL